MLFISGFLQLIRMKSMKQDASFVAYVLEQLRDLDGVHCRAMFGGHGLYAGGVFFGILHGGRLYFKTDAESRMDYVNSGMEPFHFSETQLSKTYYEVPPEVLEDDELLVSWAQRAIQA